MSEKVKFKFLRVFAVVFALVCGFDGENSNALAQEKGDSIDRLVVKAYWAPFTDSLYKFGERWETLKQLKPAQAEKTYTADELSVFLPPAEAKAGDVWKLDVVKAISVLKQLHPGATHLLHHGGPSGAYGCITAETKLFQRIRTRIHAEFTLVDGVYLPSQFAGDIVIDRATNEIVAFKLSVPPRHNNVDLNWHRKRIEGEVAVDKDGNVVELPAVSLIADIGYCERLELVGGDWEKADEIQWETEISYRDADKLFQGKFYRFAAIDWLPWEEAVAKSQEDGKPLHVVALFGVLDDESC